MKNLLIGTTALVAAGVAFAGGAQAAEPIVINVGGYMDWWMFVASQEDDFLVEGATGGTINPGPGNIGVANAGIGAANPAGFGTSNHPSFGSRSANTFDIAGNGEIFFTGSTTLDNGLEIGVDVQLEGGTRSENDPIDESYVTISGSFGKVWIGAENNIAYLNTRQAPEVSGMLWSESFVIFDQMVLRPRNMNAGSAQWSVNPNFDSDANKISYLTPDLFGFRLGGSWIPGHDGDNSGGSDISPVQAGPFEEGYALAATYGGEFSGVGVRLSGGYTNYNIGFEERRDEWVGGADFTFGGFTLGGAYRHINDPIQRDACNDPGSNVPAADCRPDQGGGAQDGYVWNVGASYGTGPWAVSLGYMNAVAEGTRSRPLGVGEDAARDALPGWDSDSFVYGQDEDEAQMVMLSGAYTMGPGIRLFASGAWVDYDGEANDPDAAAFEEAEAADNNEGFVFVTGLRLSF